MELKDAEFRDIASLVYRDFGIALGEQKKALVAGRLAKRVLTLGLRSYGDYVELVRADPSGVELAELIDRISTNHSFFYRERQHYEFMARSILPAWRARLEADPSASFRVWSAGCAAGEEAYTIAMSILDGLGERNAQVDWAVLGTDISMTVLKVARAGVYPEPRLRDLPKAWRSAWLKALPGDEFEVLPALRKGVLFKRLNLMGESYPFKGNFDVVFCRNVMIYFDAPTRKALVERIHRYVKPGGYLFVGHSESLPRESTPFDYVQPAIYRKAED